MMQSKYWPKVLSATGFMIGEAIYTHLELIPCELRSGALLFIANLLCPPALLSMLFFDVNAHSVEGFVGWLIIAVSNAGLCAVVGILVRKILLRENASGYRTSGS